MPGMINESRGMVVMEAMAKSLPVITTDRGIFPELIGKHDAGIIVKPEDPKAIAEALNALMSDPTRAEQLASNARQTIEQYYSINAMTDKALEVYEGVL
jgi:glycosyltransferase involved in cell wall biosynthesis